MTERRLRSLFLAEFLAVWMAARDAPAAEGPAGAATNTFQAVDYATLPGGGALVRVIFDEALRSAPAVIVNHYPAHRIAFDFPGVLSAASRPPIEVGQRGLRNMQVVQSGTRTRLVLYLDRPFHFETVLERNALLITLRRQEAGSARGVGKRVGPGAARTALSAK